MPPHLKLLTSFPRNKHLWHSDRWACCCSFGSWWHPSLRHPPTWRTTEERRLNTRGRRSPTKLHSLSIAVWRGGGAMSMKGPIATGRGVALEIWMAAGLWVWSALLVMLPEVSCFAENRLALLEQSTKKAWQASQSKLQWAVVPGSITNCGWTNAGCYKILCCLVVALQSVTDYAREKQFVIWNFCLEFVFIN